MSAPYRIDHIPKNTPKNRRPGKKMEPQYITIHATANEKSTAQNERAWLTNPSNNITASWHIVVDEREAIEAIPLNEVAWHAGDGNGQGNTASIGIEICESGNYAKTVENAIKLVAQMLHERGWGIDRLRRHFDWSKKNCPRLMNADGKWTGWEKFKQRVQKRLEGLKVANEIKIPELGNVKIQVGEQELQGIVIDGVSYAPVRPLAEALGKQVGWEQQTKTVTVK